MANRIGAKLSSGRKLLLAGAAALAVAGPVAVGLMNAPPLRAQDSSKRFQFEVASVKPHTPGDRQLSGPQILPDGRFTARSPLIMVIAFAYKLPIRIQGDSMILGAPEWASMTSLDTAYDIEATVPKDALPDGLSTEERTDRERLMVQALLADRFKLAAHREMKEVPVYAVVVAKGGPKLQKADIEEKDCAAPSATPNPNAPLPCHGFNGGRGRGMHGRAVSVTDIATFAAGWADRLLVDKTGITGLYQIDTSPWLPMDLGTKPAPAGTQQDGVDVADLPTLFTVFERLGLKMEPQKDKMSIVVIDHIERASEN